MTVLTSFVAKVRIAACVKHSVKHMWIAIMTQFMS